MIYDLTLFLRCLPQPNSKFAIRLNNRSDSESIIVTKLCSAIAVVGAAAATE